MRSDTRRLLQALAVLGLVLSVIFTGCSGGHGPTLPSPDGGDAPGNTIESEDFIVEAGDTVRYDTNTTIECDSARIAGEVIGEDGAGPGDPGCSITITATGDVEVTGAVRAGNGGQ